jgi:hypothetical protein
MNGKSADAPDEARVAPVEYSESAPGAPLESILCTDELMRRTSRPANRELEQQALTHLLHSLSSSPRTVLQSLSDTILKTLACDSAGVSLVNEDGTRFYWPAISGVWNPHVSGGTPRNFGPCGDVLQEDRALLFKHFERRYTYFMPVTPLSNECLLVPFYVHGKAVGTIWAITHDPPNDVNSQGRQFDREDLRLLESLGKFASKAYEVWMSLVPRSERPGEVVQKGHN